ncbi:MAG: hypothetical protein ACLP5H_22250 [Desulfomonilaceae bacterium]
MNRLLVAILLLTALLLAATPSLTVAADPVPLQDFDRNACYAKCPCKSGIMDHVCSVCKQQCDAEYWRQLNEKAKKKAN